MGVFKFKRSQIFVGVNRIVLQKIIVAAVIFPKNLLYFKDFLDGLNRQTETTFTLFLMNDSCSEIELLQELSSFPNINYRLFKVSGTISEIRAQMISEVIDSGAEIVCFADTDDIFHPNRILIAKNTLKDYNIVVSDLIPFENSILMGEIGIWEPRFQNNCDITLESIKRCNMIGLGNTNSRISALQKIPFDPSLKATDWYYFSRILEGQNACFESQSKVFYRQHPNNAIGASETINIEGIQNSIHIKEMHYSLLSQYFEWAKQELVFLKQIKRGLVDNANGFIIYLQTKQINFFWMEEINYYKEYEEQNSIN